MHLCPRPLFQSKFHLELYSTPIRSSFNYQRYYWITVTVFIFRRDIFLLFSSLLSVLFIKRDERPVSYLPDQKTQAERALSDLMSHFKPVHICFDNPAEYDQCACALFIYVLPIPYPLSCLPFSLSFLPSFLPFSYLSVFLSFSLIQCLFFLFRPKHRPMSYLSVRNAFTAGSVTWCLFWSDFSLLLISNSNKQFQKQSVLIFFIDRITVKSVFSVCWNFLCDDILNIDLHSIKAFKSSIYYTIFGRTIWVFGCADQLSTSIRWWMHPVSEWSLLEMVRKNILQVHSIFLIWFKMQ